LHPPANAGGCNNALLTTALARPRRAVKYAAMAINTPGGRPLARYFRGAATATPTWSSRRAAARRLVRKTSEGPGAVLPIAGPLRATAQARDLPGQAPGPPTP